MSNNKALAILILVMAGGALLLANLAAPDLAAELPNEPPGQALVTQADEQESATVAVTPENISSQLTEWRFGIVMNTHSVELDQDLTESSVLIDDTGKEYKPIRWEGSSGGHHREGALVFEAIKPAPKMLQLKIKDIAGTDRNFLWQF